MKTSRRALLVLVPLAASLVAAPSASAQVIANPTAVQFGKQARGTTSTTPRFYTVFNPTQNAQAIPGDVSDPPFTFDNAQTTEANMVIQPQQTVVVAVTFRPTALGQFVRRVTYPGVQVAAIGTGTAMNEIDGTDGDDRLTGTSGDDLITCGAGNDRVDGRGGNDVIRCGPGNDIIQGGTGDDRIVAGSGNDRVVGGSGNDRVNGGEGNDRLNGNSGNDKLNGSSGNDRLFGGSGRDTLRGGLGIDRLVGGPGRDSVRQ